MSTAEINKIKLDLIDWINRLSDDNMIEFLHNLKSSKTKEDWLHGLSDNQQMMVKNGLEDAESGNMISSDEFWNKLKHV